MAGKFVAVFLMCMVVASTTMQNHRIEARSFVDTKYVSILDDCMKACDEDGQHYTFCEVKCDEDTTNQITDILMTKLLNLHSPSPSPGPSPSPSPTSD